MENKPHSTAPKIVVIGGGTGSFTLLSNLKYYTPEITAVVNMVDDGGSTGKLRDELGTLPAGDVRQCLVALSNTTDELRDLFNYRFEEGGLKGHSFGNLFLSAVEKTKSSFSESVDFASRLLNVQGTVAPVTLDDTELVLEVNGQQTKGEAAIEGVEFSINDQINLWLEPKADINPIAQQAILDADLIVVAPGNLYSSLLPSLLVHGVVDAIHESSAKVVMVANLVNKKNHTENMSVMDYIRTFERYLGERAFDFVIYNNSEPPEGLLEKYANQGELPVPFNADEINAMCGKAYAAALISADPVERHKGSDELMTVPRNYIRHDADKVSRILMKIYYS